MYQRIAPSVKSFNRYVEITSLFMVFGILLGILQRSKDDHIFYAQNFSPTLEKFTSRSEKRIKVKNGGYFASLSSPFLELNPAKIFEKFKLDEYFNNQKNPFNAFSIDTTKDTAKITNKDSLSISPTALQKFSNIIDTTKKDSTVKSIDSTFVISDTTKSYFDPYLAILDSVSKVDSTRLIDTNATKGYKPLELYDSTARVLNFRQELRDNPFVPFVNKRYHPLFGQKNPIVRFEIKIDSLNKMVTIYQKVNGVNVRIPIWMKIDDYINLVKDQYSKLSWEDIAHKYEFKKTEKIELGSLLSSITNIDIPIPENPLMSIFGDRSRINLRIGGSVNITGAFRSQKTEGLTISGLGNVQNTPDFKQTVNIQVDGTVGDKLSISANWNTQAMFDFENQLKIAYKGYEDEIIQSIEAGNVGISSSSSLVGSSQALFGIKAQWQIGPVKLTTVASQKKSEKKEKSISSGSEKSPFEIRAYNYATNHFFVDTSYRKSFYDYYGSKAIPMTDINIKIIDYEVWVSRPGTIETPEQREAIADIDLPVLPPGGMYDVSYQTKDVVPGKIEVGPFIKLKTDQYIMHQDVGYITLNMTLLANQSLAIAYRTNTEIYGNFSNAIDTTQKRVVLKLIKPGNLIPDFKKAWNNQLKNIYSVGGRGIKNEDLQKVRINYIIPGQEPQESIKGINFLDIMGLDRYDNSKTGPPDNVFDYIEGITFDGQRGEIIFPYLEPFRESFKVFRDKLGNPLDSASSYIYGDIYDTTVAIAQQNTDKNRFVIKGEYSGTSTSTYRINAMAVVPGSVQVFLEGTPLIAGVDFIVDEIGGTVIIKKEEALVPGKSVQIKYEENDIMSFASKTLLGASGEIDIGKTSKLGFAWMNLSQQTLSDKVRLGEEPINNHIFGVTWNTAMDLPFITKALNYIPFYTSNDASNFAIQGDAAYMLPDPNTKKSTIPDDNGEGVAYIDDFEGARQTIPLGIGYGMWHYPSPPADFGYFGLMPDSNVSKYKCKTIWYNILPSNVSVNEIWPERKVAKQDQQVQYLTMEINPSLRGQYNYNSKFSLNNRSDNWGGVMRSLGSNATNLLSQNYTFIEIWMKVEGKDLRNAKMYIDIGEISERVITDSRVPPTRNGMHTEDGITSGNPIANSKIDPGEDVGIDGMTDDQERILFPDLGADPSGDDFHYAGSGSLDFTGINGLEGNSQMSADGLITDTEDLNKNGVLDLSNSYFEYEISLDSSLAKSRNQIVGGGNNGWYQFRLPLNEFKKTVGTPSFDIIKSIRVWSSGSDSVVKIKIAQFDIVGNQWQEAKRKDSTGKIAYDSTFKVSVVSIEETPGYESQSIGIQRAIDRTRPDQNIEANEQSLALLLNGVSDGDSREAIKYYSGRPLDVFNYQTMRLFVHGDKSFIYVDSSNFDAEFYFRFGADTTNYYEYRMPLRPGWQSITIDFAQLTSVKQFQDKDSTGTIFGFGALTVPGKPGEKYQIRGRPSLTNIIFLSVGIKNPRNRGTAIPLFGQVWVNELRLTKVNDTPGWAIRLTGSLKLANLATVSFNYNKTNPDFHTVEGRFGNRLDDRSWNLSAGLALQNLLPKELQASNLNLTYSHSEIIQNPRYIPNTDVMVTETANRLREVDPKKADSLMLVTQTLRITESYAIPTLQIKIPSTKWYIERTVNALSFGFNYNTTNDRDPAIEQRKTWLWNFNTSYSLPLSIVASFQPFKSLFDGVFLLDQYKDLRITLLPDMSFSLAASRARTEEKYRIEEKMRNPVRSFSSSRNMTASLRLTEGGLLNLGFNYNGGANSSLVHLETDTSGKQRSNREIFSDIFSRHSIVNFGLDGGYNQDIAITTKLSLPRSLGLDQFLEIQPGDYKSSYKWQNNFQMGAVGKAAGFSAGISSSVNLKLKALGDKIFGASVPATEAGRKKVVVDDSPTMKPDTTLSKKINIKDILRAIIKTPFLDFDAISLTFSQSNSASSAGLPGNSGFSNVWGRVPFFQSSLEENGPSLPYMLGLTSDPTGRLVNFGQRPNFPFFGFDYIPGKRVPAGAGVSLNDNFAQSNNIGLSTSRSLFDGFSISLNWKLTWTYNRTQTMSADTFGNLKITSQTVTSNIDRSFMAFPDFALFKLISKNGMEKVAELFKTSMEEAASGSTTQNSNQTEKLAKAFQEGFEFMPLLSKIFGSIAPRANWSIRWSGLEKLPFLQKYVNSVSINHAYSSGYRKGYHLDPVTKALVSDNQTITFSFSPLIGADFSFKEIFGGTMSAGVRYSLNSNYNLGSGGTNIMEQSSKDISGNFSFAKSGLQIPLFGLYLRNDIDFSITFSYKSSTSKQYQIEGSILKTDGLVNDGSSSSSFEPRMRYVLSSKVTGSVYYRYTSMATARTAGSSTNEGGLDVHITIN